MEKSRIKKKYSSLYGAKAGEKCLMSLVWWYFWSDLLQFSINLSTAWTRCLHSRAHLVLSLFIFIIFISFARDSCSLASLLPRFHSHLKSTWFMRLFRGRDRPKKKSFKVYFCGCCDKASLITLQGKLPSRLEEWWKVCGTGKIWLMSCLSKWFLSVLKEENQCNSIKI